MSNSLKEIVDVVAGNVAKLNQIIAQMPNTDEAAFFKTLLGPTISGLFEIIIKQNSAVEAALSSIDSRVDELQQDMTDDVAVIPIVSAEMLLDMFDQIDKELPDSDFVKQLDIDEARSKVVLERAAALRVLIDRCSKIIENAKSYSNDDADAIEEDDQSVEDDDLNVEFDE